MALSNCKNGLGFMLSVSIKENNDIVFNPYGFTCHDKHMTFISLNEQFASESSFDAARERFKHRISLDDNTKIIHCSTSLNGQQAGEVII